MSEGTVVNTSSHTAFPWSLPTLVENKTANKRKPTSLSELAVNSSVSPICRPFLGVLGVLPSHSQEYHSRANASYFKYSELADCTPCKSYAIPQPFPCFYLFLPKLGDINFPPFLLIISSMNLSLHKDYKVWFPSGNFPLTQQLHSREENSQFCCLFRM